MSTRYARILPDRDVFSWPFYLQVQASGGSFPSGYVVPSSPTPVVGIGEVPFVPSAPRVALFGALTAYIIANTIATGGPFRLWVERNNSGFPISGSEIDLYPGNFGAVTVEFDTGTTSSTDRYALRVGGVVTSPSTAVIYCTGELRLFSMP